LEKLLLFLACLIGPAIWGTLVNWAFVRSWPKHWRKGPATAHEGTITLSEDLAEIPPDILDYEI